MRFLAFVLILITIAATSAAAAQEIGLRIIVVKTEAEAKDIRARLQSGTPFEELARRYSRDDSAMAGGYLGSFVLGDLRKEFQDGLSGVQPGGLTPVLRVDGDYVLLQWLKEDEAGWQKQMAGGRQAFLQKRYAD